MRSLFCLQFLCVCVFFLGGLPVPLEQFPNSWALSSPCPPLQAHWSPLPSSNLPCPSEIPPRLCAHYSAHHDHSSPPLCLPTSHFSVKFQSLCAFSQAQTWPHVPTVSPNSHTFYFPGGSNWHIFAVFLPVSVTRLQALQAGLISFVWGVLQI